MRLTDIAMATPGSRPRSRPYGVDLMLLKVLVGVLVACYTSATVTCPQACHCANSTSQVSCVEADLSEIPRSLPPSVTTLDISSNDIHSLTASSLEPLRNVVNLKLKDNAINSIHDGAFHNMVSLQTLDLSQNLLSVIKEQTFHGAQELVHLDISQNVLQEIDGAFAGMAKLSRLDLQNNKISRITEFTFRDLEGLRYLLLAGNQINDIDRRAFRSLPKLMYLVLKGNPIGQVSKFLFNSYFLSYVDLSECGLTKVPRGLPNSIRYLQLRRNNMTSIKRQAFKDCPYVSILVLDENGLEQIEDRTFEHMTYLQQIWLNSNKLDRVPRPLPPSLLRILMDSNHVTEMTDMFPSRSQLNTLSFMGNNISHIYPDAFQKLRQLDSVDFSNNQIQNIYSETFSKNNHLKILQLSKNPLQYLHSKCFQGLKSLNTLSLAYLLTNIAVHPNSFRDLTKLKKLDLDSSPRLIAKILDSDDLLTPLGEVEDLSMQSADLSHIQSNFPDYFSNLGVLHISSTRWHCDDTMLWFRNWLLSTPVRIENKDDIRCFTPRSLHNRALISLSDYDFVPATTTRSTTTSRWQVTTFPTFQSPHRSTTNHRTTTTSWWEGGGDGSGFNNDNEDGDGEIDDEDDDDDGDDDDDDDSVDSVELDNKDNIHGTPLERNGSHVPKFEIPLPSDFPAFQPQDKTTLPSGGVGYSINGMDHSKITKVNIETVQYNTTVEPGATGDKDTGSGSNQKIIIIIIATSIATLIIAAILITIIIYLTRKSRRKDKTYHQNGIKYKQKNDVLYFMPGSGENGSTSESLKTSTSKEAMTLVPGRDINHEGPLRIYKWEDF